MPHEGEYGGKKPSKKQKAVAKGSHRMSDGSVMLDKDMKKPHKKGRKSLKAIFGK